MHFIDFHFIIFFLKSNDSFCVTGRSIAQVDEEDLKRTAWWVSTRGILVLKLNIKHAFKEHA